MSQTMKNSTKLIPISSLPGMKGLSSRSRAVIMSVVADLLTGSRSSPGQMLIFKLSDVIQAKVNTKDVSEALSLRANVNGMGEWLLSTLKWAPVSQTKRENSTRTFTTTTRLSDE